MRMPANQMKKDEPKGGSPEENRKKRRRKNWKKKNEGVHGSAMNAPFTEAVILVPPCAAFFSFPKDVLHMHAWICLISSEYV